MRDVGYINDLKLNYIKGSNIFFLLKDPGFYKLISMVKVPDFSTFHTHREMINNCWYREFRANQSKHVCAYTPTKLQWALKHYR